MINFILMRLYLCCLIATRACRGRSLLYVCVCVGSDAEEVQAEAEEVLIQGRQPLREPRPHRGRPPLTRRRSLSRSRSSVAPPAGHTEGVTLDAAAQ